MELQQNVQDFSNIENENSTICPFRLQWSIGHNPEVPILNLTTALRKLIAYASAHVVILYDYSTKRMVPLQGHKNCVKTISITSNGKWLLSADYENDYAVIIWEIETRIPVSTLFNPHASNGIVAARISPDGKYIVTIGNEKVQKVNLWLWTLGHDEPTVTTELPIIFPQRVHDIQFNKEHPEQFVLTMNHHVIFVVWNNNLEIHSPRAISKSTTLGAFNTSCFVSETFRVLTATSDGYIIIWSDRFANDKKTNINEFSNNNEYISRIRLEKISISTIIDHAGLIVTGNSEGRVAFYDRDLKLLYWCQNCGLDCIFSISFHLQANVIDPKMFCSETQLKCSCDEEFKTNFVRNIEDVPEHHDSSNAYFPTDATLQANPFVVDNFIVGTSSGKIALLNTQKLKCYFINEHSIASVTSLDKHPENHHIAIGNEFGILRIYDYEKHKFVSSREVPPLPDYRPFLDSRMTKHEINYVTCPQSREIHSRSITALKYSPLGDALVCGLGNGAVWILHSITLEPLDKVAYKHSIGSILLIEFDKEAHYLAYVDDSSTVAVFARNSDYRTEDDNFFNFVGKNRSHLKPIRGLLFESPAVSSHSPTLFSLGEDQCVIEYDLKNSGSYPDPGLKIRREAQVEHGHAVPLHFAKYPIEDEMFFILCNDKHKFRLIHEKTMKICGTYLIPSHDSPIQHMQVLPQNGPENHVCLLFATERVIGVQILPVDGNPFKSLSVIGHSKKIRRVVVGSGGRSVFVIAHNDSCVLMWSVDLLCLEASASSTDKGLSPYYCLIGNENVEKTIQEMKSMFYYAQILQRGQFNTTTNAATGVLQIDQIPNFMRANGFYINEREMEDILNEISFEIEKSSDQTVKEISFETVVKLYLNHRPYFGYPIEDMKNAFRTFIDELRTDDDLILTKERFLKILLGKGKEDKLNEISTPVGEPLNVEEVHIYLQRLFVSADNVERESDTSFDFLPQEISYKNFVTNIMGFELSE